MVPGAGLEPARPYRRGILNPLCLPIPPPGHRISIFIVRIDALLVLIERSALKFGAANETAVLR